MKKPEREGAIKLFPHHLFFPGILSPPPPPATLSLMVLSRQAAFLWLGMMGVVVREGASTTLSSHLILCRPLLLLPSDFPNIKVFSSHEMVKGLEP